MRPKVYASTIPGGNAGTRKSLAAMSALASGPDGARSPTVIRAAHSIVRSVAERDDEATIAAMLEWVRGALRYTRDPLEVELVKAPKVMVDEMAASAEGKFVGDCDDASVLLAGLLGAVGIPSKFVVVAADRGRPGEWSHVYLTARTRDGRWVAVDPIVRDFGMGDEAPSSGLTAPRAYFPAVGGHRMRPMNRVRGRLPFNPLRSVNSLRSDGVFGLGYTDETGTYPGDAPTSRQAAAAGGVRYDPSAYSDYRTSNSQASGSGTATPAGGGSVLDLIGNVANVAGKVYLASHQSSAPQYPGYYPPSAYGAQNAPGPSFFRKADGSLNLVNVGVVAAGVGLLAMIALKASRR